MWTTFSPKCASICAARGFSDGRWPKRSAEPSLTRLRLVGLLRLDVGSPDHLGKLLGLCGNEISKVGRCHGVLAPLVADIDDALWRLIPRGTGALKLLVNYVGMLEDDEALATPELRRLVVAQIHDLAALAIGATRDTAAIAEGSGVRAARLRAVKSDIVANLGDCALTITAVAQRQRMTARYVHKLFESEGITYSEFVLDQRLSRVHRTLSDPRFAGRPISSIAFEAGFGDLSYFNHAFRRRYGATPSEVRRHARRDA